MPYEWEMKAGEVRGHTQLAVHVMHLMQIAVVTGLLCMACSTLVSCVIIVDFHK